MLKNIETQELIDLHTFRTIYKHIGFPKEIPESIFNEHGYETYEPLPPVKTVQDIIKEITDAIQQHLDDTVRPRNYDGILSLCSYATSTNPTFSAEGIAGVAWRDAVWAYCYQVLADCQAGLRTIPTPADLIIELPVFTWGE